MKFLCLHGNGTNSSVFDVQTAALRHELEDGHTYEFVEATLEAPMSEGVEAMSAPGHSFYGYFNPQNMDGLSSSLALLSDYISSEGPFDAVMGFSAGAVLAAAYLLQQEAARRPDSQACRPISCAVFLAGAESMNELQYLGLDWQRTPIRIPTAHIWGSEDEIAPTGGRDLSRTCDAAYRSTMIHEGRHEVPRNEALTRAVHVIRRTVLLADQQKV